MQKQELSNSMPAIGRRRILLDIVTIGTTIVGLCVMSGLYPGEANGQETTTLPKTLQWTSDVEFGRDQPLAAKCEMLQVYRLESTVRHGDVEVDVSYCFTDGKTTGSVCFKGQLLSSSGEVLAKTEINEKRIRGLPVEVHHGHVIGVDSPNRIGQAELRFLKQGPDGVARVHIEIAPID
ncbi:MAG: hypothetical protein NTX50_17165 [Candidatus Sumerlaeota bacterium]|nr:hypothetical protein [Candidatus Sumerlaeota bacterium]